MFAKASFTVTAVVIGLAALASCQSAHAQTFGPQGETRAVTVRYGDLDLSSPAGAEEMLRRVQHAAIRICGPAPSDRLSFQRQYDACLRETVDHALLGVARRTVASAEASNTIVATNDHD